ncbi:MAG: PAS domain S-box protein [Magnetococcales bacterium]|nr:PAS domain S-box protein [Magnetococcales bacterium]NGZ27317.1 PAS domain S-box protein [Magnetococcales bacterium]
MNKWAFWGGILCWIVVWLGVLRLFERHTLFSYGVVVALLLLPLFFAWAFASYRQRAKRLESRLTELEKYKQALEKTVDTTDDALVNVQVVERRFIKLAEMAAVGIFFTDEKGQLLYVNRRWSQILGMAGEKVLGQPWTCCLRGEDRSFIQSEWQRASVEGVPFRFEYRFQVEGHGKGVWGLCETVADLDEEGELTGTVGTLTDITDRMQAELDLSLLAAAVEHTADMVSIIDPQGNMLYANTAFYTLTGYAPAEVVGKSIRSLDHILPNEGIFEEMWRHVQAGQSWKGALSRHRKDGSVYETVTSVSPIHGPCGDIVNFVAVSRDVTRENRLEAQLRQSQKLEAIGTLSGGIAHDFNNLLTPVLGFTELALDELPPESRLHQNMRMVMDAALRAKDLVAQILTFGRCNEQDPKPLHVIPIIKECLKLLRSALPATIKLTSRLDTGCGMILGDPSRIHQVVMNLCTNASQAMPAGGALEVCLDRRLPTVPGEQGQVVLTVRDNGVGMSPQIMERMYDPFFTTKEAGGGTGLGLSVVHGIVRGLKGTIEVESRVGEGTLFRISLPEIVGVEHVVVRGEQPLPKGGERVVLVDDEPLVLELGKQILGRLGYEVVTFADPLLALDYYTRQPWSIDLVITDQTMPNLTGAELAQRMLEQRRELPLILCTGFSEVMDEEQSRKTGFRRFLMKPVAPLELAKAVRECLDEKGGS